MEERGKTEKGEEKLGECFGSLCNRLALFLIVSFSGCCLIVGSLWNVSVCFLSARVGCLGDRAYCFLLGTLFII